MVGKLITHGMTIGGRIKFLKTKTEHSFGVVNNTWVTLDWRCTILTINQFGDGFHGDGNTQNVALTAIFLISAVVAIVFVITFVLVVETFIITTKLIYTTSLRRYILGENKVQQKIRQRKSKHFIKIS